MSFEYMPEQPPTPGKLRRTSEGWRVDPFIGGVGYGGILYGIPGCAAVTLPR